jgi:hypothetical protein
MRFLANENFPGVAVSARCRRAATPMPRPSDVGQQLANLIIARDDWAGHFSVIEPGRVRMRPLG